MPEPLRRAACLVFAAALVAACVPVRSGETRPSAASRLGLDQAEETARQAARRFLERYVEPDGRVVRHDQGGDTVGEAQSYALVLAEVAGDMSAFARVWEWTRMHLLRPDGLLAHHMDRGGAIDDSNSASDADVVTAWALLRAAERGRDAYKEPGTLLATAILTHETVTLSTGELVLAAGQWATGTPASLNPSYWVLPAFADLARLTSDRRWSDLEDSSRRLIDALTRSGLDLPPDWARIDGTTVTPTPAPNRSAPDIRYSLDAQRVPIWLAVNNAGPSSRLGATLWPILSPVEKTAAAALDPGGRRLDERRHPLSLVATAATADAAGQLRERDRLLAEAEALDRTQPSYYGSAWVALGWALLTTRLIS